MKLIHLSDLHLGVRVNEFSMIDEQKYILQQILQIIEQEEPDAVLIAGDVYDKTVPSAEAVALFDSFLSSLADGQVPVFVISGNHDSPERIAFGSSIMGRGGVYLSPVYHGHVEPVELTGRDGVTAQIYMLPFVKPAHVRPYFPGREINDYTEAVRAAVEEMTGQTEEAETGTVSAPEEPWKILIAHQFVTDTGLNRKDGESTAAVAEEKDGDSIETLGSYGVIDDNKAAASSENEEIHERETLFSEPASGEITAADESTGAEELHADSTPVYVGGTENVDASVFAPFDYVALGHIHRAYDVGNGRYCGTPLKYSFSEAGQEKSVTILELGEKEKEKGKEKKEKEGEGKEEKEKVSGAAGMQIRTVPLHPLHDWLQIRGSYLEVSSRKFYEQFDRNAYMQVTLTDEEDVPDAAAKLMVIYPNLMKLDYDNCRTRRMQSIEGAGEPETKDPLTIFGEFYEKQNNQPMQEEQMQYMSRLIEEIWEE